MDIGKTIGHYRIIRPLGKGGMGEVYLAEDIKLQRQVALKFLPESVRSDPDRLARLRREALAAASLKHPNIATIYALEDTDDHTFIVMEYVEGETLSARIPSDGMNLDLFFSTFIPLADALAHAHENGRIHRDLKPGNIMIAKDGMPKILDFGLARIIQGTDTLEIDSQAPTVTYKADAPGIPDAPVSLTQGRQFLGTPMYMSPEQAERKPTDARSDLFSFGVVMYEVITGQRPFKGDTIESIIGRILTEEPKSIAALKPVTPYQLWAVIRKCLKKDREQRTQTARELHTELRDAQQEIQTGTALVDASTMPTAAPVPFWRQPLGVAAVALALIIGLVATWLLKPVPEPAARLRTFTLPLEAFIGQLNGPVLSPDGTMIVYETVPGPLFIHDLARGVSRELTGTDGAERPFWSPDSRTIGYFVLGSGQIRLRTVPATGGSPSPVCDLSTSFPRGAAWLSDGRIVFGATSKVAVSDAGSGVLYVVAASGGSPEVFLAPDTTAGERGIIFPHVLPGGTLIVAVTDTGGTGTIVALDGDRRIVLVRHPGEVLVYPVYSPSGHLIYQRGFVGNVAVSSASLWARSFDAVRFETTGAPFLVADDVQKPSVSGDGTLLYSEARGFANASRRLVWVDRQGTLIGIIGQPQSGMQQPVLSPDGRRVAVSAAPQGNSDILVYDTEQGTPMRLTFDPTLNWYPVWSPDGGRIVFASYLSGNGDIYIQPSDGSGPAKRLVGDPGEADQSTGWSEDGRYVLFHSNGDMWYVASGGNGIPVQFTDTPFSEFNPRLSPDGRYMSYDSDEMGRREVYVRSFPSGEGRWQVSVNGGNNPRWSAKGDELFFVSGSALMATRVRTTPSFAVIDAPQMLFDGAKVSPPLLNAGYDVARDSRRFVAVQQVDGAEQERPVITLVQDFAAQFTKRE